MAHWCSKKILFQLLSNRNIIQKLHFERDETSQNIKDASDFQVCTTRNARFMQYAKLTHYVVGMQCSTCITKDSCSILEIRFKCLLPILLRLFSKVQYGWYVGTYKLADINQMQKGIPQSQRVFQFPFEASNEGAFGFQIGTCFYLNRYLYILLRSSAVKEKLLTCRMGD